MSEPTCVNMVQQLHDAVYEAHILVCPPQLRFLDCRREECVNRRDALAAVRGPHDRARDWTPPHRGDDMTDEPTVTTDAELDALSRIITALEELDRPGQDRIAGYLFDRYRLPTEAESTEGDTT